MKVLALDYGSARTGVAVSDPTGTIARPLGVVEAAATDVGLARLRDLIAEERPDRIVVGLPLTLRGDYGEQAQETERFANALQDAIGRKVELFDERFTSVLADGDDARAAAHLLSSFLEWSRDR